MHHRRLPARPFPSPCSRVTPAMLALLIIAADREELLRAALPPAHSGKVQQLWGLSGSGKPIACGPPGTTVEVSTSGQRRRRCTARLQPFLAYQNVQCRGCFPAQQRRAAKQSRVCRTPLDRAAASGWTRRQLTTSTRRRQTRGSDRSPGRRLTARSRRLTGVYFVVTLVGFEHVNRTSSTCGSDCSAPCSLAMVFVQLQLTSTARRRHMCPYRSMSTMQRANGAALLTQTPYMRAARLMRSNFRVQARRPPVIERSLACPPGKQRRAECHAAKWACTSGSCKRSAGGTAAGRRCGRARFRKDVLLWCKVIGLRLGLGLAFTLLACERCLLAGMPWAAVGGQSVAHVYSAYT